MNTLVNALATHQQLIETIGWMILHSLWQGTIVTIAAAGVLRLATPGRAETRYAIACVALLAIVLIPVATTVVLRSAEQAPAPRTLTTIDAPATAAIPTTPITAPEADWKNIAQSAMPIVVAIWALGVALLSVRLLGGLVAIELLARHTIELPASLLSAANDLSRRLGVTAAVRFVKSAAVEVPTVAGWLRPIVLVPASAITGLSPEQLEALLAHELAHIRRHDYLVNLLQSFVETALFYHPGVWWLSKKVREERENCCDDIVVANCADRLVYARALADLEALRTTPAMLAVAANGGSLRDRIVRLVSARDSVCSQRGRASTAVLILAILVFLGPMSVIGRQIAVRTAKLETLASIAPGRAAGIVVDVIAKMGEPSAPVETAAVEESVQEGVAASIHDAVADSIQEAVAGSIQDAVAPEAIAEAVAGAVDQDGEKFKTAKSPREEEIDRAIKRKMFDLTDEYRDSIARAGYNLDEDGLLQFRIQDVTPEYIAAMNAAGFGKLTAQQLLQFKMQDVTPELVREMNSLGLGSLTAEEITQMAMFGIDRDFVKQMNTLGFGALSPKELIQLAIHGITADDVAAARRMFGEVTLQDVVALSIHGVTPELLAGLRDRGYKVETAQKATALAIHEVTPEFIDSLRSVGVKDLPLETLVQMRIFDIDADYIRKTREAGYDDLTIEQLIRLRMAGVEPTELSRKH